MLKSENGNTENGFQLIRITTPKGNATNPFEIEVTQAEPCYEGHIQNEHKKEKSWFWNFLFGKKKNNRSKKRVTCDCGKKYQIKKKDKYVQSNLNSINKEEEKLPILKINTFGTSKEIQKSGDCPGKIFPLERRGCGCHLYFCIDNKPKSDHAKIKKIKNFKNENIRVIDGMKDMEIDKEAPKVTIYCDDVDDCSTEIVKSPRSSPPQKSQRKINFSGERENLGCESPYTSQFPFPMPNLTTFSLQNTGDKYFSKLQANETNNVGVTNYNRDKPKDKFGSNTKIPSNDNYTGSNTKATDKGKMNQTSTTKQSNMDIKSNRGKTQHDTENLTTVQNVQGIGLVVLESKESMGKRLTSQTNLPLDKKEPVLKDLNVQRSYQNRPKGLTEADMDDAIFKEYEPFRKSKSRRKSSLKSRNTFVRNSLISLRKERQSMIQSKVSQILFKLINIENKIEQLEKMCEEDKEKNITMGILCPSEKSTVSIKVKQEREKDKLNELAASPRKEKSNKTIQIKTRDEDIYLNAPENVSIVKKLRSRGGSGSKQLVYHNSRELDAHNITLKSHSKTRTIECQNPKIVIEYPEKNQISTKRCTGVCEKWRRISEELKI